MSRERPKEQPKALIAVGESGFFKSLLRSLTDRQAGHVTPAFSPRLAERSTPADPHKLFEQKRENKRGGWKKWELEKVWGPKFTPEGKLFVPESKDSRQQKRHREEQESYKYMTEHFGFEPRSIRRAMARARLKMFRVAEQKLSATVTG